MVDFQKSNQIFLKYAMENIQHIFDAVYEELQINVRVGVQSHKKRPDNTCIGDVEQKCVCW